MGIPLVMSGLDLQQPQGIGCTDPILRCPKGQDGAIDYLRFHRTVEYASGERTRDEIVTMKEHGLHPLEIAIAITASPFTPAPDATCGDGGCRDPETSSWCSADCHE